VTNTLILTVIASDEPGLVERLSDAVHRHGGSWQNSHMARLAGRFAGILEVRVGERETAALFKELHGLEASGIKVTIQDARMASGVPDYRVLQLELLGQDRPGIIRDISAALVAIEVNVVELATECTSAAMSGELLFQARARLRHPLARSVVELRETLEKIAADLMVDITLNEDPD
jgi:glycine cleavage system regulatory protein